MADINSWLTGPDNSAMSVLVVLLVAMILL